MSRGWEVEKDGYKLLQIKELDEDRQVLLQIERGMLRAAGRPDTPRDLDPEPRQWWVGTPRGHDGKLRNARSYFPSREQPRLYRTLASTEASPEGALQFTNRYGFLGFVEGDDRLVLVTDERGFNCKWEVESVAEWIRRMLKMRWTVELWDLVLRNDRTALADFIHLDRSRRALVYDRTPPIRLLDIPESPFTQSEFIISSHLDNPGVLARYEEEADPLPPALEFVEQTINQALHSRVSVELIHDDRHAQPRLRAMPSDLLALMWLQFAQDVSKKTNYRRCTNCGKWIEVGTKRARSDKAYCSNSCRVQSHRKRREEAIRLAAAGVSAGEIANRIGSTTQVVRGWLLDADSTWSGIGPDETDGEPTRS